jgi:4-hydroxyphenylpyruvate dioxygenase-like putative hemolysin
MRGLELDRVIVGTDDATAGIEALTELFGIAFSDLIDGGTIDRYAVGHPGVEVAEPGDADGDVADLLREAGPGLCGVTFRVADLEEAKAELAAKGLEPFRELDIEHAPEALYRLEAFGGMFLVLTAYEHPVANRPDRKD